VTAPPARLVIESTREFGGFSVTTKEVRTRNPDAESSNRVI
jgi:hypothetical protein